MERDANKFLGENLWDSILQIKQQLDILKFLRKSFESKRPIVELTDVKRKITVYTDGKAIIYWHGYFVCPVSHLCIELQDNHMDMEGVPVAAVAFN
jgi:galactose mutarotase-like enzyme